MSARMRLLFSLSLAAALASSSALAWGPDGHRMISTLAIQSLPDELPAFVRSPEAAEEAAYLGPEADRVRGGGKSFDEETAPAHFVDIGDDLTIAGVPVKSLPISREKYDTELISLMLGLESTLRGSHAEKRATIQELEEGMILVEDMVTLRGHVMIRAGSALTKPALRILAQARQYDPIKEPILVRANALNNGKVP